MMQVKVLCDTFSYLGKQYKKGDTLDVTERAIFVFGSHRLEPTPVEVEGKPEELTTATTEDEARADGTSKRKRRTRNSAKS